MTEWESKLDRNIGHLDETYRPLIIYKISKKCANTPPKFIKHK